MRSITRLLTRIFKDIAEGRHLESYAVTAVALVLAVVGLVDDAVTDSMKLAVILAALALRRCGGDEASASPRGARPRFQSIVSAVSLLGLQRGTHICD